MDYLIAELPLIDSHEVDCVVSADVVFLALWVHLREAAAGPVARLAVQALQGHPAAVSRAEAPEPGVTTLLGYSVTAVHRPYLLRLTGQNRFCRYDVEFTIAYRLAGGSTLRVTTRGEFLGRGGRIYRALVVTSGIHAIRNRGVLRKAIRRAEALFAAGQDRD